MDKVYEVIFQDEYNNLYLLGFYRNLNNSLEDINDMLKSYKDEHGKPVKLDEITTYPSTFNECFDREIEVEEGWVSVRGFILDAKDLEKEIEKWPRTIAKDTIG